MKIASTRPSSEELGEATQVALQISAKVQLFGQASTGCLSASSIPYSTRESGVDSSGAMVRCGDLPLFFSMGN